MRVNETLYFDHQASTPVSRGVLAEMMDYWGVHCANPHSMDHHMGWAAQSAIKKAQASIGRLIGGDEDEIFFTSGATEANNLALLGLARRSAHGSRKKVLLSAIEHKSVLACARVLRDQLGFIVIEIPVSEYGIVDPDALSSYLDDDVLLVSLIAVNNEIGTVQDLRALSRRIQSVGALLHCDAAQAPIAFSLRWLTEVADMVSLSAHKMYGPQGIGALFIRRNLHRQIEPIIYGGGQQMNLRSGTLPLALCVGMGAAAKLMADESTDAKRTLLKALRDRFVNELTESANGRVFSNGPNMGGRHPGNANLRFEGCDARDILALLQPRLAASVGSACTTGIPEPSHVLKAIGLTTLQAEASIRFSFGFDTTDEDVNDGVRLIREVLNRLNVS
jgi:cysteine desulfurase